MNFVKVAQPIVGEEEVEAVKEVILSGNYVSGRKVEEFEKAFAGYIGSKYAIAVNSGTAALHIALQAVGVGEGDEVIVPPLTFFATVSCVLYLKAIPVFADIDPGSLCLSAEDTERRISSRTKAIIPVHLFGNVANMKDFVALSQQKKIPLIEDCAQAHGSEYEGRRVGSLGRAGCFSFFATKHITTCGEGGMIVSDDKELTDKSRLIRSHGMSDRDNHVLLGFNNRMSEMEAAMGSAQLRRLDELNSKRIANSEYLLKEIAKLPWAKTTHIEENVTHTYFWCPLMVDEDKTDKSFEELKTHLKKNNIGFRQRYQEPLYKQEVLKRLGLDYSNLCLPNVEAVAGRILGLPNHPGLTQEELDRVVEVLKLF